MKFGSYKSLDRAISTCFSCYQVQQQSRFDRFLLSIEDWTPRSRIEIVQACNIARHLVSTGDMLAEERELVLACLAGIIRGVRTRYAPTARALRQLMRIAPSAQGFERDALAAVARSSYRCAL